MAPIEATAWRAARPAAKRVPALAVVVAVVLAGATAAVLTAAGMPGRGLIAAALVGYVGWRLARRLLAARAIRPVRAATRAAGLSPVSIAVLVARGSTVAGGIRWIAVVDQHQVVLTTRAAGSGATLPISTITNLGNSGGGA